MNYLVKDLYKVVEKMSKDNILKVNIQIKEGTEKITFEYYNQSDEKVIIEIAADNSTFWNEISVTRRF